MLLCYPTRLRPKKYCLSLSKQGFIFLVAVTFCLYLTINYKSYNDGWKKYGVEEDSHGGFHVTTNLSIAGLSLTRSKCMINILETLPEFALNYCNNELNNCSTFTCLNVLTGKDLNKFKNAIKSMPTTGSVIPDANYANITKDCNAYIKEKGFILSSLDETSKSFPIAFNILIHKTANQFELLLRSIYRPQNVYCVHVDSKSSFAFRNAIENIVRCFENVYLASKMESVTWAGYTRFQADITCMRDHLARKHWKYLINTAGQAFPLRTIEEMVQILQIYNGANDIEGLYGKKIKRGRFENEWIEDTVKHEMHNTGKKNPKPPHNIDIVRGSAYGIFSRKFVDFIINDQRAIDFREWARKVWSPDEIYWASLHHTYNNSHLETPGGFAGYPSNKTWLAVYANWGEKPCSGKFVYGVCINGVQDVARFIARKEFFINKFYQDYQPLGLNCFSKWISFKEQCGVPFDVSFYKKLNFIIKNDTNL